MRKFATVLAVLLVVLVVLGVSAAAYLWHSVRKQADAMVASIQPFAQASYSGVDLQLDGSVGVKNVRITPHATGDLIQIGAIRLHAPDLLALLHASWQLRNNRLPPALALTLHDMEMQPSQGATPTPAVAGPFDHLDALGCGPITAFGANDWQAMGYGPLKGTLDMGYRFRDRQNLLELRLDNSLQDMGAMHLSASLALSGGAPDSLMALATTLTPKLAQLEFSLRDAGFNLRRNTYCAEKAGKPVLDYMSDHVRLLDQRLRSGGLTLGPGWLAAYQRYLTEGGLLELTAKPPIPVNPVEVPDYTPADQLKVLGLQLSVNQTPVSDLAIGWNTTQLAAAMGMTPDAAGAAQLELEAAADAAAAARIEAEAAAAAAQRAAAVKHYHPTPVAQLSQHTGKVAQLRTTGGVRYRGQLNPPNEGRIRITVRQSGGTATFSLRPEEIASAEVLY